eukprot:5170377-Pyramimonas_sp.AAC.1
MWIDRWLVTWKVPRVRPPVPDAGVLASLLPICTAPLLEIRKHAIVIGDFFQEGERAQGPP